MFQKENLINIEQISLQDVFGKTLVQKNGHLKTQNEHLKTPCKTLKKPVHKYGVNIYTQSKSFGRALVTCFKKR